MQNKLRSPYCTLHTPQFISFGKGVEHIRTLTIRQCILRPIGLKRKITVKYHKRAPCSSQKSNIHRLERHFRKKNIFTSLISIRCSFTDLPKWQNSINLKRLKGVVQEVLHFFFYFRKIYTSQIEFFLA